MTTKHPGAGWGVNLKFAIRQGEVKDLPANPEAAARILASAYIREVSEPQSEPRRQDA